MKDLTDTIKQQLEKYSSPDELKAYATALYKTIQKLNKRIVSLEEEIEKERNSKFESSSLVVPNLDGISDEEAICYVELHRLRKQSMVEELTMEECRKVQTYVQTLTTIRTNRVQAPAVTHSMSTDELLKSMNSLLSSEKDATTNG